MFWRGRIVLFYLLKKFKVDDNGDTTGKKTVVALSGYIRAKGRSDMAIT